MKKAGLSPIKTTFAWEIPRKLAVVLPGFLVLSLLAHAATFFLFQIIYTGRVTIAAPPPSVSLLDPTRPEHQALLRLIEAEDPAPVASVQAVVPPALLELPYVPSYATVSTLPKMLAEPPITVQFPPPRDPIAIIRSAASAGPEPALKLPASTTRLSFSGALERRSLVRTPQIAFKTHAPQPLQPAGFLVGVTDRGEVRFVFLQSTSGDAVADEFAATHLTRLSFAPTEAAITWAHATFAWGDDVYPPEKPVSP
jgi:hypothetical protein